MKKLSISDSNLQRLAHWATVIAGISVAVTLWWGFISFKRTNNAQADAMAVKLMQDYLRLRLEHPEFPIRASSTPVDDKYIWFASHNVLIAETIYKLNRGDRGWEDTALGIVKDHQPFVYHAEFPCSEYDPQFRAFIQER